MINNISSASPTVTQLKRLTPKKLPAVISQEERDQLGEAQRLALTHAEERVHEARKSSLHTLERITMYQRLADEAIRRGDIAGAERAARQAKAAARLTTTNTKAAKAAAKNAHSMQAQHIADMTRDLEKEAQKYARQIQDAVRLMKKSGKPVAQDPTARMHDLAVSYGSRIQ